MRYVLGLSHLHSYAFGTLHSSNRVSVSCEGDQSLHHPHSVPYPMVHLPRTKNAVANDLANEDKVGLGATLSTADPAPTPPPETSSFADTGTFTSNVDVIKGYAEAMQGSLFESNTGTTNDSLVGDDDAPTTTNADADSAL